MLDKFSPLLHCGVLRVVQIVCIRLEASVTHNVYVYRISLGIA